MLGTEDRDGIMVKDEGLGLALIFLSSRAGVVSFVLFLQDSLVLFVCFNAKFRMGIKVFVSFT